MDEKEDLKILEEAVKQAQEEQKSFQKMDRAMHVRMGERDFFHLLTEAVCEHLASFIMHFLLIAAGAWLAFYFMKHYELEESD